MKKNNNKGFSLVELIVVVLILGILAVAVTPQIMTWVNKSNIAKDESYAGTLATAVESVSLEYIGKGWTTVIPAKIEITKNASNKPEMNGYATLTATTGEPVPGADPDPVVTAGAIPDLDKFMWDLNQMIGEGKLALPGQTNRAKYVVTITTNATSGTVTVKAEATN